MANMEVINGGFEGLSKRSILEGQSIETLIALKRDMLNKLSDLESEIHLVNDVLEGYGIGEEEEQYSAFPTEDESHIVRGTE